MTAGAGCGGGHCRCRAPPYRGGHDFHQAAGDGLRRLEETRSRHRAREGYVPVVATPSSSLAAGVDAVVAATGFSGVVRVDREGVTELDTASGLADRRLGVAMTTDDAARDRERHQGPSRPSTVMSWSTRAALALATRVRDVLGADLPLVDDRVTVEHLLDAPLRHRRLRRRGRHPGDHGPRPHRAGSHARRRPRTTWRCSTGLAQVFEPGERCTYNNSAFVVLALVAGRVAGRPFEEQLVHAGVRAGGHGGHGLPALRRATAPTPPSATSGGDRPRTNLLHLPVVGTGDGGLYTTTGDVAAFWRRPDLGAVPCPRRSWTR